MTHFITWQRERISEDKRDEDVMSMRLHRSIQVTVAMRKENLNAKNTIFFLTLFFQPSIHSVTAACVLQVRCHIEKGE